MVDWLDPTTWQSGVKTAAGLLRILDNLRKKMARTGGQPDIREHLDALYRVVGELLVLVKDAHQNHARDTLRILDYIEDHERRLAALEKAARKKKPSKLKGRA